METMELFPVNEVKTGKNPLDSASLKWKKIRIISVVYRKPEFEWNPTQYLLKMNLKYLKMLSSNIFDIFRWYISREGESTLYPR